MSKELPYFKFEPNQWDNGNIQICTREDKGLFVDLCSMYWSRLGDVHIKLAIRKLCDGNASAFDSLIREEIFKVIDDKIYIDFLDEQLKFFDNLRDQNSRNARKRWDKCDGNASASNSHCDGNAIKIREEEIRGEEKREKNIIACENFFEKYPKKKEFYNFLMKKFGYSELRNPDKSEKILRAIQFQTNLGEERYENFKDQCWHYFKYKELAKEKFHGFDSFLGTAGEKYLDGGWNDNWQHKKNQFKEKNMSFLDKLHEEAEERRKNNE